MRSAESMTVPLLFDMSGQRVLVTGAASGLGLAIAQAMLEAGAHVVLSDSDAQALDTEMHRLRKTHQKVQQVVMDVSDGAEVDRVVDAMAGQGHIDCVFANAGMSAGRGFLVEQGGLQNVDPVVWERVLKVNLDGVLATMRAASRHMKPRHCGRIIVTSSIAGLRSEAHSGYAYVASKAAVNNIVRQAAVELAPYNVLVNAIAPGPFATGLNGGRLRLPESAERMRTYVPLGRIAEPHEIKGLALLLASPASSYMTGAIIPVDGGTSAR